MDKGRGVSCSAGGGGGRLMGVEVEQRETQIGTSQNAVELGRGEGMGLHVRTGGW